MHVLLYTWSTCSFCRRAKELLDERGIVWEERVLDGDRVMSARLEKLFGGRSVMPFVLIDGEPVGGLTELERLIESGELD